MKVALVSSYSVKGRETLRENKGACYGNLKPNEVHTSPAQNLFDHSRRFQTTLTEKLLVLVNRGSLLVCTYNNRAR